MFDITSSVATYGIKNKINITHVIESMIMELFVYFNEVKQHENAEKRKFSTAKLQSSSGNRGMRERGRREMARSQKEGEDRDQE